MGLCFFDNKLYFVDEAEKIYKLDLIIPFLEEKGIALYDTATEVIRTKNNASDKDLQIITPTNLAAPVAKMRVRNNGGAVGYGSFLLAL